MFAVPGWSVPAGGPVSGSKKRKRPSKDTDKLQSAEVNLEKLVKRLKTDVKSTEDSGKVAKKKKKAAQGEAEEAKGKGKRDAVAKSKGGDTSKKPVNVPGPSKSSGPSPAKPSKKEKKKNAAKEAPAASTPVVKTTPDATAVAALGLTAMQQKLKQSLDGARFRWINEVLYKNDSVEAHKMMLDDPTVFSEYHTGFRHQVTTWPTNPVSHYITTLQSYPPKTVIADLGCGDAALAKALIPTGLNVISFDLVSDDAYVVEADTCGKLPLPGSEGVVGEKSEGEAQIVDVVVCALSLMGTNWPNCIQEAWRILKPGGELKIAEVASRFTDVDGFAALIGSIGYKFKSKDDRNSHFTLFEFKKIARVPKNEKEWANVLAKGELLKPCEYKRR